MRREREKGDTPSTVHVFPSVSPGELGTSAKAGAWYRLPSVLLLRGSLINRRKVVTSKHELVMSLLPRLEMASNHRITVPEAHSK